MAKTATGNTSSVSSRTAPPSALGLHAFVSVDGGPRDVFLFHRGTATNLRFDGLRGSLYAGVECWSAVAKYHETVRQAAAKTERP